MKRAKTVGLWVLSALQAFVMIGSGVQKFTSPAWERMFRVWGYPDHFYIVIGVVEAVCGLGLLVPRLASACGLTLAGVMIGAAVTQITRNHGTGVGEIVFMTMLLVIAYARWPGVLSRSGTRGPGSAGTHAKPGIIPNRIPDPEPRIPDPGRPPSRSSESEPRFGARVQ